MAAAKHAVSGIARVGSIFRNNPPPASDNIAASDRETASTVAQQTPRVPSDSLAGARGASTLRGTLSSPAAAASAAAFAALGSQPAAGRRRSAQMLDLSTQDRTAAAAAAFAAAEDADSLADYWSRKAVRTSQVAPSPYFL